MINIETNRNLILMWPVEQLGFSTNTEHRKVEDINYVYSKYGYGLGL
jgi:hypothetical protein